MNWLLPSQIECAAGQELSFTVSFTAPKVGDYYLLGALYDSDFNYISGTLFGVLLPEGSDYAVNSAEYTSLWELEGDEEKELPCKFNFNWSDVVLGLFLMRMVGEVLSSDKDEQVASLSVALSSPALSTLPITRESTASLVMIVACLGIMLHHALKETEGTGGDYG